MQRLFSLLYRLRVLFFFLLLELLCFWLITSYNNYYNAYFFNSSNFIAGSIQKNVNNAGDYFSLQEINQSLADENALLRKQLYDRIYSSERSDSINDIFRVIPSSIINNDFKRSANYLTINKGERDGVRPGMGVISNLGVVGTVKSVSRRFSTVTSMLHQNQMISSEVKSTGTLCTTQWDASDPTHSTVQFIPRHIQLKLGDTVVTSGFNAVFPPGIQIGTVESFNLTDESVFYEVTIKLSNDFSALKNVYVIESLYRYEKDSLESSL